MISLKPAYRLNWLNGCIVTLFLFYVRMPRCKLDLYKQYFINVVCTFFV